MGLWTDARGGRGTFQPRAHDATRLEALDRIVDWTRQRFALAPGTPITVREASSTLPGFPPRETHVTFWSHDGVAHRFRVFKPVGEVAEEDVPPAWLRDALAADDPFDCDCC